MKDLKKEDYDKIIKIISEIDINDINDLVKHILTGYCKIVEIRVKGIIKMHCRIIRVLFYCHKIQSADMKPSI